MKTKINFLLIVILLLLINVSAPNVSAIVSVKEANLSFFISKENTISLTIDFKIENPVKSATYLMLLPFLIENQKLINFSNCLTAYNNLEHTSIIFIKVISPQNNNVIRLIKKGEITELADNTMRENINFLYDYNNKIIKEIINSDNYIELTSFNYSINFDPAINKTTTIVKPWINGKLIDIIRNNDTIVIQYTSIKKKENIVAQSLMAFMIAIVTLILSLFFVNLDNIHSSKKKTYAFIFVISIFLLTNTGAIIIIFYKKIWINLLIPIISFMTPNSIAFIFILINLIKKPDKKKLATDILQSMKEIKPFLEKPFLE